MLIDLPNTSETLTEIALPLPSGHSRHLINDGASGTAQTIAMMQKLVSGAKRDNSVRKVVGSIINPKNCAGCTPKDYFCYAKSLYEWVRDNIKYAYDPHMVEFLEAPARLLENGIGDCDSQDMLLCAMFEQVGLQSQFVTIKADPNRPNEYTHVYTRVMIPKVGWVCADPIMPEKWFGWEPPYPSGKKYWASSADEKDDDVDTTDSVPFQSPSNNTSQVSDFSDVIGMSGAKARNPAWGFISSRQAPRKQLKGLGCGCSQMPVPDQITVVEITEVCSQEIESPLMDQNYGVRGLGGFFDVVGNIADSAKGALGISPTDVTQADAKSLISSIVDGTEAKKLNAARQKINAQVDSANATIAKAKTLSDANPLKAKAISSANDLRSAAYTSQYALNDLMGNYNRMSAFINNLPGAGNVVPSLSGMSGLGLWQYIAGGFVVSAAVLWIVHDYFVTQQEFYRAQQAADLKASLLINPQAASQINLNQQSRSSDWSNIFNQGSGQIVQSAITLGGVFLAGYMVYKLVGYSANVADSKIRQTLKLT